jgi:hypothetical protein
MTWTATPPSEPGRYWWRAPDKYARVECRQYGLLLVQWTGYAEFEPVLRVAAITIFNTTYGGELFDRGTWSYGSGDTPKELNRRYPCIEFWSKPERGPEGFLPELPGRPAWTPPDPIVVAAKRKKAQEDSAKQSKTEADERTKRIADAEASGETLYECDSCGLLDEDELVEVRECTHCDGDAKFNGSDSGRNCPSCNRPFTRKLTEHGCAECLEECEPLSAPEPGPAPKKRRAR